MPSNLSPERIRDLVEIAEMTLNPLVGEFTAKHALEACETIAIFRAALRTVHNQVHVTELIGDPSNN